MECTDYFSKIPLSADVVNVKRQSRGDLNIEMFFFCGPEFRSLRLLPSHLNHIPFTNFDQNHSLECFLFSSTINPFYLKCLASEPPDCLMSKIQSLYHSQKLQMIQPTSSYSCCQHCICACARVCIVKDQMLMCGWVHSCGITVIRN